MYTAFLASSSQLITPYSIAPLIVGLSLQIFITGLCIRPAINHTFPDISARYTGNRASYARTAVSRSLCAAISFFNLILFAAAWYQVVHWSTLQLQSQQDAWNYTVIDALVPVFSGVVALLVQGCFAYRAWLVSCFTPTLTKQTSRLTSLEDIFAKASEPQCNLPW